MSGLHHSHTEAAPLGEDREHAGYFPVPGAHLYTVLHQVTEPLGRVLIVGPFASERQIAYHFLVRWARYLARRRIEVLRFDYRGTGESTGAFEETRFEQWCDDCRLITKWLGSSAPSVPIVLHGIELGAAFAARIFHEGLGDALLLWSPPTGANHVLRSTLKRWSSLLQFYQPPESRRTFTEFVQELESGQPIEVEGYIWPGHVWSQSLSFRMPENLSPPTDLSNGRVRPTNFVRFGKESAPILTVPYPRYPVIRDLTPLYRDSLDWIRRALDLPGGPNEASC